MNVRRAISYQKPLGCSWSRIASISLAKGISDNSRETSFQYSTHLENKNTEGFCGPNTCLQVCNDFFAFRCEQGQI